MLHAATLDFDALEHRMGMALAGMLPSKCWLIAVPMFDNYGNGWQQALRNHWQAAKRIRPRNMDLRYSEAALMPDGRVLVMVGVVKGIAPLDLR